MKKRGANGESDEAAALQRQINDLSARLGELQDKKAYQDMLPKAARAFNTDKNTLARAYGDNKGELVKKFQDRVECESLTMVGTATCGLIGGGGGLMAILDLAARSAGAADNGAAGLLLGGRFALSSAIAWSIFCVPVLFVRRAINKDVRKTIAAHKRLEHKPS